MAKVKARIPIQVFGECRRQLGYKPGEKMTAADKKKMHACAISKSRAGKRK